MLGIAMLWLGAHASATYAVGSAPGWAINSLAQPTNFSNIENAACKKQPEVLCDGYLVTVTNSGDAPSDGTPIVINDTLPAGVSAYGAVGKDMETGQPMECTPELPPEGEEGEEPTEALAKVTCTDHGVLPPGDVLDVRIDVLVISNATVAAVANRVEVEGGGTAPASSSELAITANSLNSELPPFGPQVFSVQAYGADGRPDTQAGDHPGLIATTIDYTNVNYAVTHPGSGEGEVPVQEPKTVLVDLPMGLVGSTLAAASCPEADLREGGPGCPAASQVGAVVLDEHGHLSDSTGEGVSSNLYNMTPEAGYPLEFAFSVAHAGEILMYPRFIPTKSGYALSIGVPALPRSALTPAGITLLFFGDPPLRDAELHQRAVEREVGHVVALEAVTQTALFDNPTDCSGEPLAASVEMDSWVQPRHWISATAPTYGAPSGEALGECTALQFGAQVEAAPEITQSDMPAGYTIGIKVPQAPSLAPNLATPDLRTAEVTLPEGVAISPAASEGLVSCRAVGAEGINITSGWTPTGAQPLDPADPEAMELGLDGLPHIAPGHCPPASQVGTVEIATPLLSKPLTGHVYIAEPQCGGAGQPECTPAAAEAGELFRLYIEAERAGVLVKLEGEVHLAPATGRMTVTFKDAPQLPFSELLLKLKGGERALLANPQSCAAADTTSVMTPWGATEGGGVKAIAAPTPSAPLRVTGCGSSEPFSPAFLAQTVTATAGMPSPLTMTISRHDGEQNLFGFEFHSPPGVLGLLANVPPCPEPQASSGQCPSASQVGHTLVAVGAGADPVWESGTAYLTTGYEGAPFGLSIVTPADIGPFNLGAVITRAAIRVDPHTAALTITTAHMPQILDGVPLRIQLLNVTIDRPDFIINPTNCAKQQMTANVTGGSPDGSAGTVATVTTPFAVAGCNGLPFAPKLTALTSAKTSKANGASLQVDITSAPGSDNVGKVKVVLPKQLPSRLSTLQQACVSAVFEANPANCPAGSTVGMGTVLTPLLRSPLSGPVYLVSHGGEAFPDIEIVLQGEGVTITLDGSTQIAKRTISAAFKALPDAPFSSFQMTLPEGPDALLGANTNPCNTKLLMPAALTAQNGVVIKQTTKIAVSGCPKPKHTKKKPKKHAVKRRKTAHRKTG